MRKSIKFENYEFEYFEENKYPLLNIDNHRGDDVGLSLLEVKELKDFLEEYVNHYENNS